MKPSQALLLLVLTLTACGQRDDHAVQRFALEDISSHPAEPLPSPDTTGAEWQQVAGKTQAIAFGRPDDQPFVTLSCIDGTIHIVRHAGADSEAKALFALIGNGRISRLKADEHDGEWLSVLTPEDPLLQVFAGRSAVEATLPGAGTLNLAGSPLPGDLISVCRAPAGQAQ